MTPYTVKVASQGARYRVLVSPVDGTRALEIRDEGAGVVLDLSDPKATLALAQRLVGLAAEGFDNVEDQDMVTLCNRMFRGWPKEER